MRNLFPKRIVLPLLFRLVVSTAIFSIGAGAAQERISGDMVLLDGYTHRRLPAMDSDKGIISKPNGPTILYDVGHNSGNRAKLYMRGNTVTWSFVNGPDTIVMDEPGGILLITRSGIANFEGRNIRSPRDIAEMFSMVYTHDMKAR
jgi:hypothetical protein